MKVQAPVVLGIACVAVLLSSCQTKNVTVSCKNIQKYQSNFGQLNLYNLAIGNILELAPKAGSTIYTMTNIKPGDFNPNTPAADTSVISNADFEITGSGDLPSNKTEVETYIKNSTLFVLTNGLRKNLSDPAAVVNRDKVHAQDLLYRMQTNPSYVYAIVQGVVAAEEVRLKLKSQSGGGASTQLKYGGGTGTLTVNVTYACQGNLDVKARDNKAHVFVKILTLTPSGNSRNPIQASGSAVINLADYPGLPGQGVPL